MLQVRIIPANYFQQTINKKCAVYRRYEYNVFIQERTVSILEPPTCWGAQIQKHYFNTLNIKRKLQLRPVLSAAHQPIGAVP